MWTGSNNALKLTGSYSQPDYAALVLSSSSFEGLRITSAGDDGVYVGSADDTGLYISQADDDGVRIRSTGDDGIQIGEGSVFPTYGLYVPTPGASLSTLLLNTANAAGEWALYTVDKIEAGNVFLKAQTLLAVVGGDQALTAGDVVAAIGLADPIPGSLEHLAVLRLASGEATNVVGAVSSRMALQPLLGKVGQDELRSAAGPALPGDYVAITVLGVAQVKVQAGEAIQPGQRLTVAATPGQARAVRTVQVEGVQVDESGPTLGVALEPPKDGLV